eukprot:jgi/Bigna1/139104/aug1.48_g13812
MSEVWICDTQSASVRRSATSGSEHSNPTSSRPVVSEQDFGSPPLTHLPEDTETSESEVDHTTPPRRLSSREPAEDTGTPLGAVLWCRGGEFFVLCVTCEFVSGQECWSETQPTQEETNALKKQAQESNAVTSKPVNLQQEVDKLEQELARKKEEHEEHVAERDTKHKDKTTRQALKFDRTLDPDWEESACTQFKTPSSSALQSPRTKAHVDKLKGLFEAFHDKSTLESVEGEVDIEGAVASEKDVRWVQTGLELRENQRRPWLFTSKVKKGGVPKEGNDSDTVHTGGSGRSMRPSPGAKSSCESSSSSELHSVGNVRLFRRVQVLVASKDVRGLPAQLAGLFAAMHCCDCSPLSPP